MFTVKQAKNFVIPLVFCKILFTNGCGSDQSGIPKSSKEINNELQELKRLKNEFELQRISHTEYIENSLKILMKLNKQYGKGITSSALTESKKYKKAVNKTIKEYRKIRSQHHALLETALHTKKFLREVCDLEKINSSLELFLKNKIITLKKYDDFKKLFKTQNYTFSLEDFENLGRTLNTSNILNKKINDKQLARVKQIIIAASDNGIISNDEAKNVIEILNNNNQLKDIQKIALELLEKLESKIKIDEKTINEYINIVQNLNSLDKKVVDAFIKFLSNFNKNIDNNSAKQIKIDAVWKKHLKTIIKIKIEPSFSYLSKSFKTQLLPDLVKNKKKKRKTLKSNKVGKTKKALEQIKNILDKYKLGEIKLYTLAKSKIIKKDILIDTIKFFDRLNINKTSSLNEEEIKTIKKVKSFVREHGLIAIVQNHITGEQFSLEEINSLINVLSKLKR